MTRAHNPGTAADLCTLHMCCRAGALQSGAAESMVCAQPAAPRYQVVAAALVAGMQAVLGCAAAAASLADLLALGVRVHFRKKGGVT